MALPDSRGNAQEVRISGTDTERQAKDSGPEFRQTVWHQGGWLRQSRKAVQAGAQRLRAANVERPQDSHGVAGIHGGQYVEVPGELPRIGRRAGQYPLRLDSQGRVGGTDHYLCAERATTAQELSPWRPFIMMDSYTSTPSTRLSGKGRL